VVCQQIGCGVFQAAGSIVSMLVGHSEFFDEEYLPEAVFAQDRPGQDFSLIGQGYTLVGKITDHARILQFPAHFVY